MRKKEVEELLNLLGYKKPGDKPKYNRNFNNTKVLPFFSRNPERAKFTNGFHPIISAMLRISSEENAEYEFSIDEFEGNLSRNIGHGDSKEEFIELLVDNFTNLNFKNSNFIKYIPLSAGKEKVGEVEIALLLYEIFDLSNLDVWIEKLNNAESKNLLDKLLSDSFPEISKEAKNRRKFALMDSEYYTKLAKRDLTVLLKNREYFMENSELFFAYYYFFYVTQVIMKIQKRNAEIEPIELYYALDTERITGTRLASTSGYNKVIAGKKDLLPRLDYLDYLNILIGEEKYYFTKDISDFNAQKEQLLQNNINEFNHIYANLKGENRSGYDLESNTKDLFDWLKRGISDESISRFSRSLDEIGKKYFLKPRGRLGNTLNISRELLLLFTAIIVDDKKMLVDEVFTGFENRGFYFDRYTKTEILQIYNNSNILEKKSDSGDAQYVKPIL